MDTVTDLMKSMVYVILLCLYLKTDISLAADTITINQSLSGDQTIVSAGGVFELGFFNPGNSNYYIGIWYRNTRGVDAVWVANREQPVSDTSSSELRISDGNLVLFNESKSPIWSTNVSSTSGTSVRAVLLDNGNLVLRAGSNSSQPSWQSFDHPTHVWLPGGRIGFSSITKQSQILTSWKSSEDPAPGLYSFELDRNGTNSYFLVWNRSIQYWTSGPWDEKNGTFSFFPRTRLNYSYVTNKNESYSTYSSYDPILSKLAINVSGQVQQLAWLTTNNRWNLLGSQPRQQCQVYAFCGAFGSCNEKPSPFCNCLNGFEPKSKVDWDLQHYSGGCSRRTGLYSGNATSDNAGKDRFLDMPSMSLPANQESVDAVSIVQCESICLNNRSCTAYAYDRNGCSIWIGDLFNLQQLTGDDSSGTTLYLRLAASEFKNLKSNTDGSLVLWSAIITWKHHFYCSFLFFAGTTAKSPANKLSLVIATVLATAGLLTVIVGCILWKKTLGKRRERRRKYDETRSNVGAKNDAELPVYNLKSILLATNNFSETNKLGEGGFGPVYKGILTESQEVAIKRLSKKSGQGHQEFMNELKLIAKLQHTNLVRLLGCCIEEGEMILIYEYMPNRSLDKFLFETNLDWDKRFQIIEGVAQGVLYIHKYSRLKIIHRDLKASNVLLDEKMKPKISDFGMARIFGNNQTEANTNRVVGTYGYMAPEYGLYGQFSEKSDVFSYGVLLLEIVSGKRSGSFYHVEQVVTLAGWAWELWKEGKGMEVIDASIRETCRPHEALRCIHVGFLCLQQSPADRPTMSSVIHMLQASDATSLPPSKEPAFSTDIRNSRARGSSSETSTRFSNNEVTISLPEAR